MCISRNEKTILSNQVLIINGLKNVRNEFKWVDNLLGSRCTMLNSIGRSLDCAKSMFDEIENKSYITENIRNKIKENKKKADDIRSKLDYTEIETIKNTIMDVKSVVNELKREAEYKKEDKDIKQLQDIIIMLDSNIIAINSIEPKVKDIVPELKNIILEINNIKCSLNTIDRNDIKGNLIQIKNNFCCRTGLLTTGLIIIIAILTALPFCLLRGKSIDRPSIDRPSIDRPSIDRPSITCKGTLDLYVLLDFILIILALAGIWALAFIYIKSRLKIDEQDNMAFRRSLDDC